MKYLSVTWPEIQDYMDHPDYPKECYYDSNKGVWFIPENWETEICDEFSGGDIGDLEDALG